MKLTVKEVVHKKFRILQLLSSLSSIFLDSQQVFCCGGKIYTHLMSSVGSCTEISPWPPAHPTTIHLTADTGVPLGWSFAFCGIISHLQWWFRQMLHHAGELPSVVMRESMLQTLEIHFKFTFEPQTSAGQQKKSCNSLSNPISDGHERLTEKMRSMTARLKTLRLIYMTSQQQIYHYYNHKLHRHADTD